MVLVILDRDGVLNRDREDFVKSPAEFEWIESAIGAVGKMKSWGWTVVVATNQSAVGRGIISKEQLDEIHDHMQSELGRHGAALDGVYAAYDDPAHATERRKPGPGMLIEAMRDHGALPGETVMIGDALRDIEAAQAAGCHRCLVLTGKGGMTRQAGIPDHLQPVWMAQDLPDAAEIIKARFSKAAS